MSCQQRSIIKKKTFFQRVWKEITLNSTSDQVEYRVWDYPIREQYGHIFQAITSVGAVKTVKDGLQKVSKTFRISKKTFIRDSSRYATFYDFHFLLFLRVIFKILQVIDSESAEFAFIHDSSEIKYYVTKNCNLTEVGEVFAEQPYAIAVQQGSHLQEEISRR